MKRRNWAFLVVCAVGITFFVLSRTLWGTHSKAVAAETSTGEAEEAASPDEPSDAKKRYMTNAPRHWRYVMLKH
jgi:hypothetical protein